MRSIHAEALAFLAAAALIFGLANGLAAAKLLQDHTWREGAVDVANEQGQISQGHTDPIDPRLPLNP